MSTLKDYVKGLNLLKRKDCRALVCAKPKQKVDFIMLEESAIRVETGLMKISSVQSFSCQSAQLKSYMRAALN